MILSEDEFCRNGPCKEMEGLVKPANAWNHRLHYSDRVLPLPIPPTSLPQLLYSAFPFNHYETLTATSRKMAKKRKRFGKNNKNFRRRSTPRFWIEVVPESFQEEKNADLTIRISRSLLVDRHHQSKQGNPKVCSLREKQEKDPPAMEKGEVDSSTSTVCIESALLDHKEGDCHLETPNPDLDQAGQLSTEAAYPPSKKKIKLESLSTPSQPGQKLQHLADNLSATGNINISDRPKQKERQFCIRRQGSFAPLQFDNTKSYKPLPKGDCGDGITNPSPSSIPDKYWAQRHRFFSRYDQGIQLDAEGWYSVTPQVIAEHIAEQIVARHATGDGKLTVLDAFCGCGGNAIALAAHEQVAQVICVDTNRSRLEMTAHNAGVYNIAPSKLLLIHGDACAVMRAYAGGKQFQKTVSEDETGDETTAMGTSLVSTSRKAQTPNPMTGSTATPIATIFSGYPLDNSLELLPPTVDAIFLSPPWGGPEYLNIGPRQYSLSCIQIESNTGTSIDGNFMLQLAIEALVPVNPNVSILLPRNTNGLLVAHEAGLTADFEMEMNYINGKFKTITMYTSCSSKTDTAVDNAYRADG